MHDLQHNPDVLSCLANLSSDEVFTPPEVANAMLDMLPQELWQNSKATFLDPACKSGVFLREIAKRLIEGLKDEIPDLRTRLDHIFQKQLYGIAITNLTALLSRRSLYGSKCANGKYSFSRFDTAEGLIRLNPMLQHTWKNGRCEFCGASQSEYDRDRTLESYAYEFIHTHTPEKIFKMKFDVIIGNPPYQLNTGGSKAQAIPLYHKFIEQAKKLSPRYLTMIIPSRWFSGGFGLDSFRESMISDKRIRKLYDFIDSTDCFGTGVEIKGGVCYFLWTRDNEGPCHIITREKDIITESTRYLKEDGVNAFIRRSIGVAIYHKVKKFNEPSISNMVSSQKPFDLGTSFHGRKQYRENDVLLYENGGIGYISKDKITKNIDLVDKYKVFISAGYNGGEKFPHQIINKPILSIPNSCCTETYIVIGSFLTEYEAKNLISYIQTKFFRCLVMLLKNTQHALKKVYQLVPIQDFSKPWTDAELYAKYSLDEEEIAFIESMIKPMDVEA